MYQKRLTPGLLDSLDSLFTTLRVNIRHRDLRPLPVE